MATTSASVESSNLMLVEPAAEAGTTRAFSILGSISTGLRSVLIDPFLTAKAGASLLSTMSKYREEHAAQGPKSTSVFTGGSCGKSPASLAHRSFVVTKEEMEEPDYVVVYKLHGPAEMKLHFQANYSCEDSHHWPSWNPCWGIAAEYPAHSYDGIATHEVMDKKERPWLSTSKTEHERKKRLVSAALDVMIQWLKEGNKPWIMNEANARFPSGVNWVTEAMLLEVERKLELELASRQNPQR